MRRIAYLLADLLGMLTYWMGLRRRVALRNLGRAGYRDCDARRVLRRAHCNLARSIVDLVSPPPIQWNGWRRFEELRAQGRGVLVLTAHIGAFDLLACETARRNVPIHIVSRRIRLRWLNRIWWRWRGRSGLRVHDERGSAKHLVRALKRGEVVGLVIDQHAPRGIPAEFFGELAMTNTTLARLARATGAPVLPVFLVRKRTTLSVEVRHVIGSETDILAATRRYNTTLEQIVSKYPDQWFWWHRRWKPNLFSARSQNEAANLPNY